MKLKQYFKAELLKYQAQLSRYGAAYLLDQDGNRIDIERKTDIDSIICDGYQLVIDEDNIPSQIVDAYKKGIVSVGLFNGRHELPVNSFVFEGEYSAIDFEKLNADARRYFGLLKHNMDNKPHTINLYITGLSAGTIAALSAATNIFPTADIVCWHYDRDNGEYIPQNWE